MAKRKPYFKREKVLAGDATKESVQARSPKRPGVKGKGVPINGQVVVSIYLLHRAYKALEYKHEELPPGPAQRAVLDAMRGLYERVGDAIFNPKEPVLRRSSVGRPPCEIEITWTDGTIGRYPNVRAAAEAIGMRLSTLQVGLSRGHGHYKRVVGWDAEAQCHDYIKVRRFTWDGESWLPPERTKPLLEIPKELEVEFNRPIRKTVHRRKLPNPENADARDEHIENE